MDYPNNLSPRRQQMYSLMKIIKTVHLAKKPFANRKTCQIVNLTIG